MSWGFLTPLLEGLNYQSTFLGKLWFTTFLVLRIVLTAVGGESIYYDEHSSFDCNTVQSGCTNVCYDSFAPLSHVRFWAFNIIAISIPTILYLAFATQRIARNRTRPGGPVPDCAVEEAKGSVKEDFTKEDATVREEEEEKMGEGKATEILYGRQAIKKNGLMGAYVLQLLARTLIEVGFLTGQYLLYGFEVNPHFECSRFPCPHRVDCFISRPTEKTVFLLLIYSAASLNLLLDLAEMWHLGLGGVRDSLWGERLR